MNLKRAFQLTLNLGVKGAPPLEAAKIRAVNAILLALIIVSLVGGLVWEFHQHGKISGMKTEYIDYGLMCLICVIAYSVAIFSNAAKFHEVARFLIVLISGVQFFWNNAILPDQIQPQYWAVAFSFSPLLIFSRNEKTKMIIAYCWFVGMTIASEMFKARFVSSFPMFSQVENKYVGVCTLSAFCAFFIYYYRAAAERAGADLAASNEQLQTILNQEARHLEWLRNMAAFLRHEVRQPLAQINSSIELSQLVLRNDARVAPYLSNAGLGVQQVANLIERASRATDIEAFVRQSESERVDLRRLLAAEVEGFTTTYSGLSFRFHGDQEQPLVANVDPTLIKEAVGNLLSNAASYAPEDSDINVRIFNDAGFAVITVDNKGPEVPANTEALFGPFSSTRAGVSSVHQGLGLYLVRLVVQHYGGRASLGNLPDGVGVRAMMWIPLANQPPR